MSSTTSNNGRNETTTQMKAAIATGFGEIDANVFVRDDWPKPTLVVLPSNSKHDDDDDEQYMIIRVLACALAPGDVRVLSGKTDYVQLPPGGHPYVIGSDVCGIVVETPRSDFSSCCQFGKGDVVVSRFDEPIPVGGLAEYRRVKVGLSERAPTSLSPVEACTLPASAMAAKVVARKFVKPQSRVLILGGSGGVGTFLCQYCKSYYSASFVAATSTQTKLLLEELRCCDRVIDYRKENWWEIPEFQKEKFDVVLDLVNGDNWEKGGRSGLVLKRKAPYVQLLTGVATELEAHGPMDMAKLAFQFMGQKLWTRLNPFLPTWHAPHGLELHPGDLAELFQDVDEGRIRVALDPASPFPFTQDGVRRALALQKSTHAHGKVVIKIADE